MANDKTLIATSALITTGVGYIAGVERGAELPTARMMIGIGLTFTIISAISDLGSPLGGAFALLIMVAAILSQGIDALHLLNRRRGKAPEVTKKKGKSRKRKTPVDAPDIPDNTVEPLED